MQCGTDDFSLRPLSDSDIRMYMNLYASFGLNIIHYFVFADTAGIDGAIDWAADLKRGGVLYERIQDAISRMDALSLSGLRMARLYQPQFYRAYGESRTIYSRERNTA